MLVLPTEVTHTSAKACARMLMQASSGQQTVVADASGLAKYDSSVLAVLLECRREAQLKGLSFSVRGLPAKLRSLATLYGVAELLPAAP